MKTQKQRVRRALLAAGQRGITAVEFIREPTADLGPPILRLPSRIIDVKRQLLAEGFEVITAGRRDSCVIYKVRAVASSHPSAPEPPALLVLDPALFERVAGAAPPRCAIFDVEYER